jgi:hypothetical protein
MEKRTRVLLGKSTSLQFIEFICIKNQHKKGKVGKGMTNKEDTHAKGR